MASASSGVPLRSITLDRNTPCPVIRAATMAPNSRLTR